MTTFTGTSGDNTIDGTGGADTFVMGQGGDDTVTGDDGADIFQYGAALTAADTIDGGTGPDTLRLTGDYSAGVTFAATTLTSVEAIQLHTGFSYNLTENDANATGDSFAVNGGALGATDTLTFDGRAETDTRFSLTGGAGDDVLKGGAGDDSFHLEHGGEDNANGGTGNDVFVMGAAFDAGDRLDGGFDLGAVPNVIRLDGDYSAGVTLGANTIANIYEFQFDAGHDYKIIADAASFLSGPSVIIQGGQLGATNALTFDGSASDANFHFFAGAGNDVLTGGTAFDVFDLSKGGNDTVSGGGLRDIFRFGTTLNAADHIDGGAGTDTVDMTGMTAGDALLFGATTFTSVEILHLGAGQSYALSMADGNVAAGQSMLIDASALGAGNSLSFLGGSETNGTFTIRGGAGNDTLNGGAQADTFNLTKGGNDIVHGGGGDDTIAMGATLTATDAIDGGTGNDILSLDGDYSTAVVFGAATMTGVETLKLAGGHSYNLKPNAANVAHGATLTVDASALGASDTLTLDASSLAFLTLDVTGGAGDDVITGAFSATITLDLSLGGNDTVHSKSGSITTFLMGAALTANDQLDGAGSGSIDLDGDYTGGHAVIMGATTITNMQNFTVEGGHSYNLTADAATLGTHQLRVFATGLLAGDTLTFDGSATVTGVYQFNAGAGTYSLTGGTLNDQFNMGASFTASDHVNGGVAGDDALDLNGDYSAGLVFGAATMVNIANLQLTSGHSYNLTTNNATVASGATLTVDASALGAADTMSFDGSAETNGFFAITSGAGSDTITLANASVLAGSAIDGGAGSDTLNLNGDFSAGVTFSTGTMVNVETLHVAAGHDYNLTTDDANVASGASLTVDASALGAGDSLVFNGSAESDGRFAFFGGAGDDALTGGAGNDSFTMGANLGAGDAIDGGGGNDTMIVSGDYSAGVTFTATTMVNVENLTLGGGHDYKFTTDDATIATGSALTINMVALGTGHTLTLDASAETDGFVIVTAGAAFTAADSFIGGSDGNLLILNGDYSSGLTFGATTAEHLTNLELGDAGGASYSLTMNDANVDAGATLTVDASALTTGALTFNGAAETDGKFVLGGGGGNDVLTAGQAGTDFDGGAGADTMTAGAGADIFGYNAVSESTGDTTHDRIIGFNASADSFHFQGITVGAFDGTVSGTVDSGANFDTDIGNASGGDTVMHGNHAWVVFANSGTLAGHNFLVVDTNNNAHYDAGTDYVIDITGFTGSLTSGDFI